MNLSHVENLVREVKQERRGKRKISSEELARRKEAVKAAHDQGRTRKWMDRQFQFAVCPILIELEKDGIIKHRKASDFWQDPNHPKTQTLVDMMRRGEPQSAISQSLDIDPKLLRQIIRKMRADGVDLKPKEKLHKIGEALKKLGIPRSLFCDIRNEDQLQLRRLGKRDFVDEKLMEFLRNHQKVINYKNAQEALRGGTGNACVQKKPAPNLIKKARRKFNGRFKWPF